MSALDSINDKCWAMLDALSDRGIPIGEFFDKYNLPPILFPLIIALVVLVVVWLLLAPAGGDVCGDGTCSENENMTGLCPTDCPVGNITMPTSGKITVDVEIQEDVKAPITVLLYDKDNNQVSASQKAEKESFHFDNIEPQTIKASLFCPNAKTISSLPKSVTKTDNIILIPLPSGCFDTVNDPNPVKTYGAVIARVSDASTLAPLSGAEVDVMRVSDDLLEESATTIGGEATINVRSGNRYYLMVKKSGYDPYNGDYATFYMPAGGKENREIPLVPTADQGNEENKTPLINKTGADKGILRVCAFSGDGPLKEGILSVNEVGKNELDSSRLISSDKGCINFTIEAGKVVKASLLSPPADCIAPSPSEDITIKEGKVKTANLTVQCGAEVAYVKVMVNNKEGDILTDKTKITLWNSITGKQIRGTASDYTLSMGSSGYTEELTVPADTLIQAKVTEPPLGYVDTNSQPEYLSPKSHGTITVLLGEVPTEEFTFSGATIVFNPVSPGMPVKIYIGGIQYNGTNLTDQNSRVSVIIGDDTYDASYENTQ